MQLSRTEELVERWEKPSPENVRPLEKLPEINQLTANLVSYSDEAPKWLTTLGMYQGDRVKPHLRRYYANVLRREMVQPIIAHDVQSMTDFGFRYESLPTARPTPDEQAEQYPLLKLHLLLTKPKAPSEPAYGDAEQSWVAQQVAQRWLTLPGKGAAPAPDHVARAQKLAVEYAAFHREYEELAFTRDRDVVIRERAALTRAPFAERALERIVETVDEEGWDLTLDRLIGRTAAIQSTVTVPGAFTRRGWENKVREMIDAGVLDNAGELWVLGLTDGETGSQAQLQRQLAELSSLYFRGYIDAWQSFLRGLRIDPPPDNTAALTLLRDLTRGQPPPLSLLLQKVHYNVQLKPKEEEKSLEDKVKDGAIDAIKNKLGKVLGKEKMAAVEGAMAKKEPGSDYLIATDVAKAFEDITGFAVPPDTGDDGPKPSVPYEAYHEQLFYVRDALQMQMDNPEERDQLISKLQAARVRVRSIIDEQPVGYRPTFDQLFWPPVEGASSTSGVAMAGSVGGRWCTEVYAPFESMIRGHYPFDPNGHDLSLDELARFYGPEEGIVPMFVKDALSRTVELDGDQYTFAKALGENASNLYSPALLEFLERSMEIASVFYPRGSKVPSVDFEVMVHPSPYVATTTMSVGGKKIEYHNGPEKWETLTWPGEKPEAGASFVLRGANGMNERISQDNVWGLFRLIEAGTITRSSSRTFTVAWQLQTHNVTLKVDFRPVRGESPFFGIAGRVQKPVFLQSVRTEGVPAPRAIVASAKPCKG
jgi:type VI secretion system protein ImpL